MTDTERRSHDPEAAAELEGVPADMIDDTTKSLEEDLARLSHDLETAKQDVLYAKAETQNVRRRLEKDDVLSVADNIARALEAIPADLRADDKFRNLVAGLDATGREIEKVFASHGITRIAAKGLPLDPHQHQAMIEMPSADVEPGTVVQELQAGYMIKDRLLRAAMVAVAKKPD